MDNLQGDEEFIPVADIVIDCLILVGFGVVCCAC